MELFYCPQNCFDQRCVVVKCFSASIRRKGGTVADDAQRELPLAFTAPTLSFGGRHQSALHSGPATRQHVLYNSGIPLCTSSPICSKVNTFFVSYSIENQSRSPDTLDVLSAGLQRDIFSQTIVIYTVHFAATNAPLYIFIIGIFVSQTRSWPALGLHHMDNMQTTQHTVICLFHSTVLTYTVKKVHCKTYQNWQSTHRQGYKGNRSVCKGLPWQSLQNTRKDDSNWHQHRTSCSQSCREQGI